MKKILFAIIVSLSCVETSAEKTLGEGAVCDDEGRCIFRHHAYQCVATDGCGTSVTCAPIGGD